MSDLVKTPAELASEIGKEMIQTAIDKPLSLLPPEWRMPVWGFWAKFASLLKSQLDLAASLREWIVTKGLQLDEARKAFASLSSPERRELIRFPGDVVAELAREVDYLLTERARRERREEGIRAAQESRERAAKTSPEEIREIIRSRISGIGLEPSS